MAALFLAAAFFFVGLEFALRLLPSALPLDILEQFEPSLRSKVASRLGFQTRKDTVLLPRDDGGPPDIQWVYRPGALVTWAVEEPGIVATVPMDEGGFCNPPGVTGPVDVIAIGDSLTFCTAVEVEATWVARLAEAAGIRAYNLALPGRGLYEYLHLLRMRGLARSPRVVVMTVYEGNDFRDAHVFHHARSRPGEPDRASACPFRSAIACRAVLGIRDSMVGRHSLAVNFLTGAALHMGQRARKKEVEFRYRARLADGTELQLNSRNGDRDEVTFAAALADGRIGTEIFDEALRTFVALGREHGFEPVIVYIPSAYTAFDSIVEFDDESIHRMMRDYSARLRSYFAEQSGRLGYVYLDATPALSAAAQKAGAGDTIYFPVNVHLTAGGHRVVADAVAGLLREHGLPAKR